MTVSILMVDDESDVAELYRQRFRREVRQGTYAMHFANSGEDALGNLSGGVEPNLIAILSDINMPGMDGLDLLGEIKRRYPRSRGVSIDRLVTRGSDAYAQISLRFCTAKKLKITKERLLRQR
jgi:CheY-like chemotaxis protein